MTHGMSARFEEMVYAERQMIQDLKQENQLLRDKIAELEAEIWRLQDGIRRIATKDL